MARESIKQKALRQAEEMNVVLHISQGDDYSANWISEIELEAPDGFVFGSNGCMFYVIDRSRATVEDAPIHELWDEVLEGMTYGLEPIPEGAEH